MNTASPGIQLKTMSILFGIVLPLFCAYADPYVFSGNGPLSDYIGAGYSLILVGVLAMSFWLAKKKPSPQLAGVFFACSLLSVAIGLLIAPMSFIGLLLFGLGLLGFVPFVTAYVFYRQGRDILAASPPLAGRSGKCVAGICMCLALLFTAHIGARRIVESAVAALASQTTPDELQNFTAFCAGPLGLELALIREWRKDVASDRGRRIAAVYEARFGLNIEFGEAVILD